MRKRATVVTLAGVKAGAPPRTGTVMNEKCGFVPRVQVIAPGGTMKTSSRDPVLQATVVQESNGRQLFNVALPAPGIEITKSLGDGTFTLTGVPPGTQQLRVWHEALQADPVTVTVAAGKTTRVAIEMK